MAAAAGTITGGGWTPNGWTESATTIAYAFVWKGTILTRGWLEDADGWARPYIPDLENLQAFVTGDGEVRFTAPLSSSVSMQYAIARTSSVSEIQLHH